MAPVADPDIPDRRGGWWHEYVCPVHGTQLLPPVLEGEFPCPHGCTLTGEPYAGAWAVLAHQAAARSLRSLAVAAPTDPAAGDACLAGLLRYAALYRELAVGPRADAQGWMLAGKLFQQALTEAIWGTSIALAVQTLVGSVPPDRLRPVTGLLEALRTGASEARDALLAKDDFRNNYTAWLNACGASTSRALALMGAPDLVDDWLAGPHGVAAHVAASVYPDGWEWEGSTYYHVFVLRAYLLALRGRPVADTLTGRLADMVTVVTTLATDRGGVLPALNDTPYGDPGWDEEIYELCLLASGLPDAPDLEFLAAPLASRLPAEVVAWRRSEARGFFPFALLTDTQRTPPVETTSRREMAASSPGAPVYAEQRDARRPAAGPPGGRGHRLFADAGYAVLHGGGVRAVLDLGPHGGSHGHLDKLALYLYGTSARWQPAYGVPPYGHPLRKAYYRRTAAHSTLAVDGADQAETTGRLLYWRPRDDADLSCEVGAAAEVYPGVRFERHVRTDVGSLIDVVWVAAEEVREFELHLRSDVDVTVRHVEHGAETHWPGDGGLAGRHAALCTAADGPARLFTGADLGPADDPQRSRPHLRWRARAETAVFASVYAPAGSTVTGLHLAQSGTGLTVHVDRSGIEPIRWSIPATQRSR